MRSYLTSYVTTMKIVALMALLAFAKTNLISVKFPMIKFSRGTKGRINHVVNASYPKLDAEKALKYGFKITSCPKDFPIGFFQGRFCCQGQPEVKVKADCSYQPWKCCPSGAKTCERRSESAFNSNLRCLSSNDVWNVYAVHRKLPIRLEAASSIDMKGPVDLCPLGSYVNGIRIRSAENNPKKVAAVHLECGRINGTIYITSAESLPGRFHPHSKTEFRSCPGGNRVIGVKSGSANWPGFNLICSDRTKTVLRTKRSPTVVWQYCRRPYGAICGLQTNMDPIKGYITHVTFMCCNEAASFATNAPLL